MRFHLYILLTFSLLSSNLIADEIVVNEKNNSFNVINISDDSFIFRNALNRINTQIVKTENASFVKLIIPSYTSSSAFGSPELLSINKLINY